MGTRYSFRIRISNLAVLKVDSESARVYSKVVSLIRKVKRKKGFWLSQGAVQKYMLVPIESGSREYGTWLQSP